jgi:hypothetical protein
MSSKRDNRLMLWQGMEVRAGKHANADLKRALRDVMWLGGSVCADKTSAATVLAERHGLRVYHFDRQEPLHICRSVPERQPHLIAFMAMTMDQRWVLRSPDEMARQTHSDADLVRRHTRADEQSRPLPDWPARRSGSMSGPRGTGRSPTSGPITTSRPSSRSSAERASGPCTPITKAAFGRTGKGN